MGASDVLRYRLPNARLVEVSAVAVLAVTVILTLVLPSRDVAAMIPIVALGGWIAWVVWGVPAMELSRTELLIRNSLHTVRVPLAAISEISGGKRLTIRTIDRRIYIPAAVPGMGSFLWGAVQRMQAHGGYVVPLMRVDRLRLDVNREMTPATVFARVIRKRMDELSTDAIRAARNPDGTVRGVPPPVVNKDIILATGVVAVASVTLFLILV